MGGRPEFRRHDIDRNIHEVDDQGIALADTGGFGDDQIESGRLGHLDDIRHGLRDLGVGAAGGQRAHVDSRVADGVHADAIAQQGTAGLAARRVGTDNGHPDIFKIEEHALDKLVGQGRFPGAPRSGDTDDRDVPFGRAGLQFGPQLGQVTVLPGLGLLHGGDQVGHQ